MYQEETLKNVIRSVTRNGRSIILTALLALILVYLFSIFGFLFFRDDFLLEVDHSSSTANGGGGGGQEMVRTSYNSKETQSETSEMKFNLPHSVRAINQTDGPSSSSSSPPPSFMEKDSNHYCVQSSQTSSSSSDPSTTKSINCDINVEGKF